MKINSQKKEYYALSESDGKLIAVIEKPAGEFDIEPKVTQALKEHFDAEVKELKKFEFSKHTYGYTFDAVIEEEEDEENELNDFELIPCAVY